MNYYFSAKMKQIFINDYKSHESFDFISKNIIPKEMRGKLLFDTYPVLYDIYHKCKKANLSDEEYKLSFEKKKNEIQTNKNNYYTNSEVAKKISSLKTYNNYYIGKLSVCQQKLSYLFENNCNFSEAELFINQKYLIDKIKEYETKIEKNSIEINKIKKDNNIKHIYNAGLRRSDIDNVSNHTDSTIDTHIA